MNLPGDFIQSVDSILGDESGLLLSALAEEAPVSVHINPFKYNRNPMEFPIGTEKVYWNDNGFYLKERPAFTFDPLFHSGYYYVQEASSMFVEYVVKNLVYEPVTCLDLSAAPGGKSVGLLSALPAGSLLVCNELIRQRANVLSETITKFGVPNAVVTNNSPGDFRDIEDFFDVILIDAPCSGEGMFRKDEIAIEEWSTDNVQMCAARQKDIINDIWGSLKDNGLIIYSTCTYNISEDEENAEWIANSLGAEFITVEINPEWGISPSLKNDVTGYRFFPYKTRGEGLFVTILRKRGQSYYPSSQKDSRVYSKKRSGKSDFTFLKDTSQYKKLLLNPEKYDYLLFENRVVAFPKNLTDNNLMLHKELRVVSQGILLGELKGKDFIPSQSLAMSIHLNQSTFNSYELTYDDSIAYLRNQAIQLTDALKGFIVVTYKNEPLGFVKNLGNRANNLYPKEWRIRSGHLPENATTILSDNSKQ